MTTFKYGIFAIISLLSGVSAAQSLSGSQAQVTQEMHQAMVNALEMQKPGLGMRVLAVEDGQHVLAGGNGRYVIKGELRDLWNGVQKTGTVKQTLPVLPALLNPERFYVSLGNPEGIAVQVFMKSNCIMCDTVFAVLTDPIYLNKYRFNVMLVGNDKASDQATKYVYCAQDKVTALEALLNNPHMTFDATETCDDDTAELTTKVAMALNVRALPMMHFPKRTLTVIGDPSELL